MKDILVFIGLIISILILFFGNYASFAWVVIRWSKKPKVGTKKGKKVLLQPSITSKERFMACIPVWQAVEVRKALHGSAGAWGPIAIVSLVFIGFNLLISWVLPINSMLLLVAHILNYIGLIMSWVTYAVITASCAKLYDFGKFTIFLNVVLPNVFCFYIKNNIPTIMRDMYKDKTFDDKQGSGNTVVKRRGEA